MEKEQFKAEWLTLRAKWMQEDSRSNGQELSLEECVTYIVENWVFHESTFEHDFEYYLTGLIEED